MISFYKIIKIICNFDLWSNDYAKPEVGESGPDWSLCANCNFIMHSSPVTQKNPATKPCEFMGVSALETYLSWYEKWPAYAHPRLHVDQRARAWFDGGKGDLHCKQTKRTLCRVFFFRCLVGDVLRDASLRTPNHNSWPSKQVLRISTKLWWSKFQAFPLLPYCSHHHLPVSTHPIRGTSGEVECYSLQA